VKQLAKNFLITVIKIVFNFFIVRICSINAERIKKNTSQKIKLNPLIQ